MDRDNTVDPTSPDVAYGYHFSKMRRRADLEVRLQGEKHTHTSHGAVAHPRNFHAVSSLLTPLPALTVTVALPIPLTRFHQ